jgi:hypothetical protein
MDRMTAKRFISLIDEHLIGAAVLLFEASAIYGSEEIQKSRPRFWRDRLINEQVNLLEALTAKPKQVGRPKNSTKDCLRKEDETKALTANVILAVKHLNTESRTVRISVVSINKLHVRDMMLKTLISHSLRTI